MHQLDFKHIKLIPRKCIVESRKDCNPSAIIGTQVFETPVMLSNMAAVADYDVCKEFALAGWLYCYPRTKGPEDVYSFLRRATNDKLEVKSISVGITEEWEKFLQDVKDDPFERTPQIITIDVAHSHSDNALEFAKKVRSLFPNVYLIFGNGCTPEWVKDCYDSGVIDCVKLGIGVSRSCRTYQYTGFGSTTVHDLELCVTERDLTFSKMKMLKDANPNNPNVPNPRYMAIMLDGGLTVENNEVWIGDIAKAIGLGADFVMSGAFVKMCTDSLVSKRGGLYYGNASRNVKSDRIEGMVINVPTNGLTMCEMRKLVKESLQSSISYGGGKCIDDIKGKLEYQIVE